MFNDLIAYKNDLEKIQKNPHSLSTEEIKRAARRITVILDELQSIYNKYHEIIAPYDILIQTSHIENRIKNIRKKSIRTISTDLDILTIHREMYDIYSLMNYYIISSPIKLDKIKQAIEPFKTLIQDPVQFKKYIDGVEKLNKLYDGLYHILRDISRAFIYEKHEKHDEEHGETYKDYNEIDILKHVKTSIDEFKKVYTEICDCVPSTLLNHEQKMNDLKLHLISNINSVEKKLEDYLTSYPHMPAVMVNDLNLLINVFDNINSINLLQSIETIDIEKIYQGVNQYITDVNKLDNWLSSIYNIDEQISHIRKRIGDYEPPTSNLESMTKEKLKEKLEERIRTVHKKLTEDKKLWIERQIKELPKEKEQLIKRIREEELIDRSSILMNTFKGLFDSIDLMTKEQLEETLKNIKILLEGQHEHTLLKDIKSLTNEECEKLLSNIKPLLELLLEISLNTRELKKKECQQMLVSIDDLLKLDIIKEFIRLTDALKEVAIILKKEQLGPGNVKSTFLNLKRVFLLTLISEEEVSNVLMNTSITDINKYINEHKHQIIQNKKEFITRIMSKLMITNTQRKDNWDHQVDMLRKLNEPKFKDSNIIELYTNENDQLREEIKKLSHELTDLKKKQHRQCTPIINIGKLLEDMEKLIKSKETDIKNYKNAIVDIYEALQTQILDAMQGGDGDDNLHLVPKIIDGIRSLKLELKLAQKKIVENETIIEDLKKQLEDTSIEDAKREVEEKLVKAITEHGILQANYKKLLRKYNLIVKRYCNPVYEMLKNSLSVNDSHIKDYLEHLQQKLNEYNEMKDRVSVLEQLVQEKENELSVLSKEHDGLRTDFDKMSKDYDELQLKHSQDIKVLEQLKNEMHEKESLIESLYEQIEDLKQRATTLEANELQLQQTIDKLSGELETQNSFINKLHIKEHDLQILTSQFEDLKNDASTNLHELEDLKQQYTLLQNDHNNLIIKDKQLENIFKELSTLFEFESQIDPNTFVEEVRTKIDQIRNISTNELQELQAAKQNLTNDLEESKSLVSQLQTQLEQTNTELNDLKQEHKASIGSIQIIKEKLREQETLRQDAITKLTDADKDVREQHIKIKQLEEELSKHISREHTIHHYESYVKELQSEIDQLKQELDEYTSGTKQREVKTQIDNLNNTVKSLTVENTRIKQDLKALRTNQTSLEEQLKTTNAELIKEQASKKQLQQTLKRMNKPTITVIPQLTTNEQGKVSIQIQLKSSALKTDFNIDEQYIDIVKGKTKLACDLINNPTENSTTLSLTTNTIRTNPNNQNWNPSSTKTRDARRYKRENENENYDHTLTELYYPSSSSTSSLSSSRSLSGGNSSTTIFNIILKLLTLLAIITIIILIVRSIINLSTKPIKTTT